MNDRQVIARVAILTFVAGCLIALVCGLWIVHSARRGHI